MQTEWNTWDYVRMFTDVHKQTTTHLAQKLPNRITDLLNRTTRLLLLLPDAHRNLSSAASPRYTQYSDCRVSALHLFPRGFRITTVQGFIVSIRHCLLFWLRILNFDGFCLYKWSFFTTSVTFSSSSCIPLAATSVECHWTPWRRPERYSAGGCSLL